MFSTKCLVQEGFENQNFERPILCYEMDKFNAKSLRIMVFFCNAIDRTLLETTFTHSIYMLDKYSKIVDSSALCCKILFIR